MFRKNNRHTEDLDNAQTIRRGLHSLLMMLVGSVITIMIAVFLYLSPFFDVKPPQIEPQTEVRPLPEAQPPEYEFYEVLPEQEFRSVPEGVSVQSRVIQQQASGFEADAVVTQAVPRQNGQNADTQDRPARIDDEVVVTTTNTSEPQRSNQSQSTPNNSTDNNSPTIRITQSNPSTTYILQVRSYIDADLADQRRAEVIMAGVDAEVLRRRTSDGQTLYQVVSTPMDSRDTAMTAYQRLQNAGIDAIIVEQRQ